MAFKAKNPPVHATNVHHFPHFAPNLITFNHEIIIYDGG